MGSGVWNGARICEGRSEEQVAPARDREGSVINPATVHLPQRRTYNPSRAEVNASLNSCS